MFLVIVLPIFLWMGCLGSSIYALHCLYFRLSLSPTPIGPSEKTFPGLAAFWTCTIVINIYCTGKRFSFENKTFNITYIYFFRNDCGENLFSAKGLEAAHHMFFAGYTATDPNAACQTYIHRFGYDVYVGIFECFCQPNLPERRGGCYISSSRSAEFGTDQFLIMLYSKFRLPRLPSI